MEQLAALFCCTIALFLYGACSVAGQGAPTGAPMNFDASIEDTVLTFTWDPPATDSQNGDIVSYFLSCSINSVEQFELNLTSAVEEISLGAYEVSSTYTCTISASNSDGEGPTTSAMATTGDSTTPAYLPFILLNSIYEGSNAVNLTATDDSASPAITLPTNFPFGDTNRTRAYVGTNGYITFGTTAYTEYRNGVFPGTSGQQYITAGFWDDIHIANGGFITYEVIESGAFLDSVNAYIKRKRPTSFEGTWMLVASYEKVAPFSGTGENTFQIIIISDGEYSYSIFTYKCGLMEWDNNANIGYSAGGDPYANHDPSSNEVACVNSPDSDWSNVIYLLTEITPEDTGAEDLTESDIAATSVTIGWTIANRRVSHEYVVNYGTAQDNLDKKSATVYSISSDPGTDELYEVGLTELTPYTTYYYQVETTLKGFTFESDLDTFTTLEQAPSGSPMNFDAALENTVITFTWDPVAEEEQNGYVSYYTLQCSINSEKQFELNLTYSVEEILIGVYEVSSTYSCTISASNAAGEGPTASDSVTTGSNTDEYLPFIPIGILYEDSNEVYLSKSDDTTSVGISIPPEFPFNTSTQTTVYVGSNGLISFGTLAYNSHGNAAFPGTTSRYLIAPYWDDINIASGGTIGYETFESGAYLDEVNAYIQAKLPTRFEGIWMLVAHYNAVHPYRNAGENTFQAILITDGLSSITIFTYKCGLLEWDNGVTIGYNAAGDPYDNYDPSSSDIACENDPNSDWNNVVYVLSENDPDVTIDEATASDVGTSTTEISWTVSFIPEQLEFVVYYGTDQESLNDTSDTVTTSDDTVLEYSTTLTGLSLGTTYYFKVVATYSDFTIESDVGDFTTNELAPSGEPQDFTYTLNDTVLLLKWMPPIESKRNGAIISYTVSCTVGSDTIFEYTLKATIREIYWGVYERESDTTCEVYASTAAGGGPTASVSFTTGDASTPAYLPFIPIEIFYGDSNATNLTAIDDGASSAITLPTRFPFGDSDRTTAYVGTNGYLTFGSSAYTEYRNSDFPGTSGQYIIAGFWDDINIGNSGYIMYEVFESGDFLDYVNAYLKRKRPTTFEGTWMLLASYEKVTPFSGSDRNTFQIIIISDREYSYSIFTYKCGLMEWDNGANIGYSAAGDPYANHDPSSNEVACVNSPDSDWSNVVYQISTATPEDPPPEDVEISNITSNSAEVSWIVPSLSTAQDYVVEYGEDEDNLDLSSDAISQTDTTLINEMYSVTLEGLSQGVLYYVRVAATDVDGATIYSTIKSFRTIQSVPTGAPQNFSVTVEGSSLTFVWSPPPEDEIGGTLTSYTLSCSSDNGDNFDIDVKGTAETIKIDEFLPSTDYTCTILASTNDGDGPTASVSITTEESTEAYLHFLDMDTILGVTDVVAVLADDGATGPVSIEPDFPFGDSTQAEFYVGTNGIISFGTSAYNSPFNSLFPVSGEYLVAPYWDDIDIRYGNGRLSYEAHDSGFYLDEVSRFIARRRPSEFQGTWMAVIFYDRVRQYPAARTTEENSFQVILITDGTYSYAVFTYNCNLMEWSGSATIGFTAGSSYYDNHDPSTSDVACLNSPDSNWTNIVYLLSSDSSEAPIPNNIELYMLQTSSVNISWNIPSISEVEEYIVLYGMESDSLNLTSSTIDSVSDTTLQNQAYSVVLDKLDEETIYYFQVLAQYGFANLFKRYSDIVAFRTLEREQIAYLPFLNHTDTYIESGYLELCDDCTSGDITLSIDFPFGDYIHQIATVDTDGWIAFGQSIEDAEPETFPPTSADVFWTFVIAPFWGNLSSISSGLVSWEIHNNTHSPEIFDLVNQFIEYEYGDGNFNGTWMFIGFWEDLLASETISNNNTFQAVLVTNGTQSYAVFTYECGDLDFPNLAVIGYYAPLGPHETHPLSDTDVPADTIACVHLKSVWNNIVYDLTPGDGTIYATTPEPSDFIGSCVDAGFSDCCVGDDCSGLPDDCQCDAICHETGDCCYDIDITCPNNTEELHELFVANGEYIHHILYDEGETMTFSGSVIEAATGIDFLYNMSVGFWSDTTQDKIYGANLNGSNVEELINSSILAVDDLAVDWISNKLYWVDAVWARIEVLDLETYYRAEVLRIGPNTLPRAIAVDPESRFMFWTDWAENAKIERSFMDGSDRRSLISSSLSQPNGITIDYYSQKIYWSDSGLDKIEYSNFDGSSRTTLKTSGSGLDYPFSLTVANNLLFWSDLSTNKVYVTHKVHGSNTASGYFTTVALFSSSPYGIEAVLSSRQKLVENPCEASDCEHICLLNDLEDGFSCVCAEGYGILSDRRSCKVLDEPELPPSEGSCLEAGYNGSDICCTSGHCSGIPAVCSCDLECYERGDCCSDIGESCTEGTPVVPSDVSADDITTTSANISWTISSVAITRESYTVKYGFDTSDLKLTSDTVNSRGQTLTNQSYFVVLEDLVGVTTYYYQVVSKNDFSSSSTDIYSFSTAEGAPSGPPLGFSINVNRTTLECSWSPPAENRRNGIIISYTLSCLVDDEMVFNENLSSTVESFSIDFYAPNMTYKCNIYASTGVGDGPSSDYITVTTTDDVNFLMVLPFISIDNTYNFDVVQLEEIDDGGSGEIQIPGTGFPFGDVSQTSVYVGTNGLISFGSFYNEFQNEIFPGSVSDRYLVAPFWNDIDIRDGNGEISYEMHDSGYYLDHVSGFIRAIAPSDFMGTWMLVAYWDAVHPYIGSDNPEENTFQAILITDGEHSYAVFTYMCGLIEWDNDATIGFNSAGGRYANSGTSASDVDCQNSPDSKWTNVLYRLSEANPEYPPPDNVEVLEIADYSAVVSWTVEYVMEQQQYYLVYGSDENMLDETSYFIVGNSNTSLRDQTYNITLDGLTTGTTYYVTVIATYSFTTLFSDTVSFTTREPIPEGPPLNYKVIPRGTGLYFRWDAPEGNVTILSYTITCYMSSDLAINVTLNTVNSVVLDEFSPSTTYTCSMYASSSGGKGPATSSVDVATDDDTGDVYLPFLSLDVIYGAEQVFLSREDNGTSDSISAGGTNGFPFGSSIQTQLYVGTNGLLSFEFSYNPYNNEDFPGGSDTSSRYLVAPFWDDVDISRSKVGQISYEIHQSGFYLGQVNDFLQRKRPSSFTGTWMIVAYWNSVRPYPGSSSTSENSFQAVLITDGTHSYSIFTYNCSRTEWGSSVTIGFNAAGDAYENHDPSSSNVACLNTPYSNITNVIYLLSDENPEFALPELTELDVMRTSVNISWMISYLVEQEEYYIIYGFEFDELDFTTDSILSVSNTSLENQIYSLVIDGLKTATVYYGEVVAAFGMSGEFQRYSDIFAFRTKENEQAMYLEFLPHTKTSSVNGTLQFCNDCTSSKISLPDGFPFGGYFHDSAYISTNGLVSFGRPFTSSSPEIFPSTTSDVFWRYITAVFWADWDTSGRGTVSWELHSSSESRELLEQVDTLIQVEYGDTSFIGSWMLVSFWENVTSNISLFESTFQEILITNRIKSYAVYTYKCGELNWLDDATIGANAPIDSYYNHPLTSAGVFPDEIACVHLQSIWNNVIIDLEPNPLILPSTPQPLSFVGSCVEAGFTECCFSDCLGFPSDCSCDDFCRQIGDCCYDIDETCPIERITTEFDILVANGFYIHHIHFEGNSSDIILTNTSETAVGIDFNYDDEYVVWSDVENDIIYRADLDGRNQEVLVDSNINVVDDLAVDWVSSKVYWVDAAWARIEVIDLSRRYRAEVLRTGPNTNPRAIAVEPTMRFMFWTDWGEIAKIEQSFMDGSGRRTIVDTDLSQPNAITADYVAEKIYWADSDLDKIEYANYDGSQRMTVATDNTGLRYPFSLTVAADVLFWTDWGTNTLYATHKQHGVETSEGYFIKIATFTSTPYGIEALDSSKQLPANNTCFGIGCSHVCVMSDISYTCLCPYGFSLEKNLHTCKEDDTTGSGGAPLQGSCIDAGYSDSCCEHGYCAGFPFTCFCDRDCHSRGDCCTDIDDTCPESGPMMATNVIVMNVTSTTAIVTWTISRVVFTYEEYVVYFGQSMDSLSVMSETLYGTDLEAVNVTYMVTLSGLEPLSTYYYQIVSSNSVTSSSTAILDFTTIQEVPSGTPTNFSITVEITNLICTWSPPDEAMQNGEIISYTLTCTSGSETLFKLTLKETVFEISIDLFSPSTTYTCSIAASNSVGQGPSSTLYVGTDGILTPFSYLPFIPLGVKYGSRVSILSGSDEGTSDAILLPSNVPFPFSDSLQTQLFVGINGLISFDDAYSNYFSQPFPGSVSSLYLVAPFWDDVDTREGNGEISYEIYESGYFLDHVSAFVRKQRPSTFQGTWMVVVYWDAVHPYLGTTSPEENTFQAILITDGTHSYTVFTYKCGLLEWGSGATIGFNAPGGFYANHELSFPGLDCVNKPASVWSNIVYLLSNDSTEFEVPRDITVASITTSSAVVSWTVPSITEPQDYYIIYGTSQYNLYRSTNRIKGDPNTSLVDVTYSITLQNLEPGTKYYIAVVAEFRSTILFSSVASFTTTDIAPDGPPQNFTISVEGASLSFSWQPPSGERLILSYTLTCSIRREVQFIAEFKPILNITLDELMPSTAYVCSIFASTSGGDGPATPEVLASTDSVARDQVYLPFIPLGITYGVNEISLPDSDGGTSNAIVIPIDFPFGDSNPDQFYVGTNGLLSFGTVYKTFRNQPFPDFTRYLVAPFWDDVDTRGGNGKISYEIHNSGYFLKQVNTYLNRKRPSRFQGTWMALVLYDAVHPYIGTSNPEENTFQAVLITDGNYSYTIFTYKCGLMEWDNEATIGFNAAGNPYENHNPSSSDVACINLEFSDWSNVDYLLSNENPEIPAPDEISAINVTATSAVISWTILRFIQTEEYYVQYGTEEIVLDMTTSSIQSSMDTSLVNQTYSIPLSGLRPNTIYYFRVGAVSDTIISRFSELMSFRTYDEEQVIYLQFLNHTDTYIDSGVLGSCDDCSSTEITFPADLPFGNYFHQSAYVSTNGFISFGRSISSFLPELFPTSIPEVYWGYILAPFWADLDTTENGSISWELHDNINSPQLLDEVSIFIQTLEGVNFNGSLMLVAYWEDITQYANTFQVIVISDGIKSYSVFTYMCGELVWPNTATIGYNIPLMDYVNSPLSGNSADSIACSHLYSPWNNIVYDLQPGNVILPTTPMPSNFIGSCVEAGYTECCEGLNCLGSPDDCFCDTNCLLFNDCCYDFRELCPNTTAPPAYDILVATGQSLETVHYQGSDSYTMHMNYSENTLAVDFNYKNAKAYWSHTDLDYYIPAKIYSANFDGSEKEVLVDTDILFVSDIAVDWIAGNLYWVDSSWARIEAMNLASLNRTEILRTGANTNPSAIAVDPLMRYMFWSDLGVTSQIERASMDGSERRAIINSDIVRPVGITIDYSEQKIYWSDVDLYRLEYCDYDGGNRLIVETEASGLLYPFALTIANNALFWTDWATNSVYATHKQHGSDINNGYFQTIATFSSDPFGIEALLETRQQPGENPCQNSTCSHICLLSSIDQRGYTCVCPEGYIIGPDDSSCRALNGSGMTPPGQGSCSAAGYTSCCNHGYCAGYPPTCFCHPDCTEGILGCCSDFGDVCPAVPPLQPTNLVPIIYSTSAQVHWMVPRAVFGFEAYSVVFGFIMDDLSMQSNIIIGGDLDSQNTSYSIVLESLQPLTTYYYSVRAENLAGVTFSDISNFTTEGVETSSIMVTLERTTTSQSMPTITDTRQLPQSTTLGLTTSIPTTTASLTQAPTTDSVPSSTQTGGSTAQTMPAAAPTSSITSTIENEASVGFSTTAAVPTQTSGITTTVHLPILQSSQQPSSSVSVILPSESQQQPSSTTPSGSQLLTATTSGSQEPSLSTRGSQSGTIPAEQTSSVSLPTQTITPVESPVQTTLPSSIEENSVKVTLSEYDLQNFTASVQLNFKMATAEAVNVYCGKYSCQAVKLTKRQILQVESKNVGFLDISDSSNGLTVIVYVLIPTGEVLDGDSLLASIQNGPGIYKSYNFTSVMVEKVSGVKPKTSRSGSGGLSAGAIAGIVISAFLVTVAVVLTAAYIFYHIRKKGLYKVDGLVGGYDNPMTDKFSEFESYAPDNDEVKKNLIYEEAEGKL